jgi:hypothetical protein
MGAGSEPKDKPTTIFDEEARNVGKFVSKNKKWNTQISFNGGHATTESIISTNFPKSAERNRSFTGDNFEAMITTYEMKIESGEIKSGDQLLVYITTHGAIKNGEEKTHKIGLSGKAATDLTSLKDAELVSLDRIQNLIDLAEKKGVKLGLLDFSCHSGSTLSLRNPNTCIIAASGPEHFGYADFGKRFSQNMMNGKNLEEVFLQTFKDRHETAFPMISTPAGMSIQNELYKYFGPYLLNWHPREGLDKFTRFIENQVEDNKCEEANVRFAELSKLIKDIDKIVRPKGVNTIELKNALTNYHQFQKEIKDSLKAMNYPALTNKKEKFCTSVKTQSNVCSEWTLKEILIMDVDDLIKYYETLMKNGSPGQEVWFRASIENFKKAKEKKIDLVTTNNDFKKYSDFWSSKPDLQNKTWQLAMLVSFGLQDIYEELYRKKAAESKEPNPCKSFKI